jgi:hypothetical protein
LDDKYSQLFAQKQHLCEEKIMKDNEREKKDLKELCTTYGGKGTIFNEIIIFTEGDLTVTDQAIHTTE